MADRRRRKLGTNEDSEGSEESDDDPTTRRKSIPGSDGGESEYESADEEELAEDEDDVEELVLISVRGGPEEEGKPLDDDEDRKNPQYIPKKGTFYEHDDRTAEEPEGEQGQDEKPEEQKVLDSNKKGDQIKKKVWKEDDRWNHDKFIEVEQSPKSREELISIYGYDIRNEEGAPRARRRRRYGRGPNKYTRNWEDLDAYAKPARGGSIGGSSGRGSRAGSHKGSHKSLDQCDDEFPALPNYGEKLSEPEYDESKSQNSDLNRAHLIEDHSHNHDDIIQHPLNSPLPQVHHHTYNHGGGQDVREERDSRSGGLRGRGGRGGSGRAHHRDNRENRNPVRDVKDNRDVRDNREYREHKDYRESREYKEGNRVGDDRVGYNYHENARGNNRGGQHHKNSYQAHQSEFDEMSSDLNNLNINSHIRDEQQTSFRGKNRGGNSRGNVPPRLQEAVQNGTSSRGRGSSNSGPANDGGSGIPRPKRYSSQRQRSLPEQQQPPPVISPQYQQPMHQPPYIDSVHDQGYHNNVYDTNAGTGISVVSAPPPLLPPHAVGGPPSFVPPVFPSPPTYQPETFLGRPPAPRMFPPVTQAPHLMGPPGGGPPMGNPVVVSQVGAPPMVSPSVPGPPIGVPPVNGPPVTGPPPFLPPENMINYGPPPPHPGAAQFTGPPPPQFPPFQAFTVPVSQPAEIYSNGVVYYNTESQQHLPRSTIPLQKRPKAAIPIVPPPERTSHQLEVSDHLDYGDQDTDELNGDQDTDELNGDQITKECENPQFQECAFTGEETIHSDNCQMDVNSLDHTRDTLCDIPLESPDKNIACGNSSPPPNNTVLSNTSHITLSSPLPTQLEDADKWVVEEAIEVIGETAIVASA